MGKKKAKVRSSREDDEFEMTGPACRHIRKGTDQTLLKKISGMLDWTRCQDCKNEEIKRNVSGKPSPDSEDEKDSVVEVWMCMKCGHRGCGRSSKNQHAIKHYETPRSDLHCLVISLDSWSVWCYECDDEVRYSATSQLAQLVSGIKKTRQPDAAAPTSPKNGATEARPKSVSFKTKDDEDGENLRSRSRERRPARKESTSKAEDDPGVPIRGLCNLGNTCFFNAVIQNLSQTQLLRQTLGKVIEDRSSLSVKPASPSKLKSIVAELDRPGSLTVAMNQLLNEIQESKKEVVRPQELFTQVCTKAARFKGYQQQDSQELLRYLLDGMRAEESKRVSTAIAEALKRSGKHKDEEQLKSVVKEYEKNGLPKNFVDRVFGGEITSTIMCQRCKTVSVVTEMFLDLSLPVSDQAYRKKPPSKASDDGREGESEEAPAGSKYQQKKAKKQAKKQAKENDTGFHFHDQQAFLEQSHQKRQHKLESRASLGSLSSPSPPPVGRGASESGAESPRDSASTLLDDDDDDDDFEFSLVERLGKISLNDASADYSDTDSEGEGESEEREEPKEREEPEERGKEYRVVNQDPELAFQTLARRPSPDKQECSVESCLFHFTEEELLSDNNSLLCVNCTRRLAGRNKAAAAAGAKKNVYTEASKQMLISSPPPVLTLHLKRFQQNGYGISKVNRHVPFPLLLDLAPFCALKSKNVAEGERRILYGLYGIVEHSGTMRSGHYTAFVKVRPHCSKSKGLDGEAPRGSWFHISDTSVQPVTESRVQSSQAYLLFYERIG
ncbi:ubiquitin carboxyl-terminal hydrolase 16 isoform X2 [Stigmatopora argus]